MMASFMSYFTGGRKDPKQTAREAIVTLRQQLQLIEKKEEYLQKKIEEETKKARANAVSNKAVISPFDYARRWALLSCLLMVRNVLEHHRLAPPISHIDAFFPCGIIIISSIIEPHKTEPLLRNGIAHHPCWSLDSLPKPAPRLSVATAALKRKKATEVELDRLAGSRLQLELQVNTLESANLNAETMAAMKKGSEALKVIHGGMTIESVDTTMAAINEQRELANEISQALADPLNAGLDIDEDELKQELGDLEQEILNERLAEADHVPAHLPPSAVKATPEASRRPAVMEDDEDAQLKELQAALAM